MGLSKLVYKREKLSKSRKKEANRSEVGRDGDLNKKFAEKRCGEQQRGGGKVAAKKEEIN